MVEMLSAKLWDGVGLARSGEITALYVERYDGPRERGRSGSHDYWEFTFVFKGRGELRLAEGARELRMDDLWLIGPGVDHGEWAAEGLDTLWVGVKGSLLAELGGEGLYKVTADRELKVLLERLWLRAQRPYGSTGGELDGLAHAVWGSFMRQLNERALGGDYIDRAVRYMTRNFGQEIGMGELAAYCGYSEGYFYRQFRKRTGKTPIEFLTQIRMGYAERWLRHTTWPIEKIAHEVGYSDALYFSRVFRKVMGMSPTAYRGG